MGVRSSHAAQTRAWAAGARRRGARLASCGLAACAALLIGAGPAQAVTFVVDSTRDEGMAAPGSGVCDPGRCTLRAAIQAARDVGGTNTITLVGLPDPSTINLDFGALPTISGQTLTIIGPGQDALTVRRVAGVGHTIFTTSGSDVSISGMTITNGRAVAPNGIVQGGGIYSLGGRLELDDVAVVGNAAVAAAGDGFAQGGGIHKEQGTLTIRDSTISQNSVDVTSNGGLGLGGLGLGGGISAVLVTDLEVVNSTIADNGVSVTGPGGMAARGGGISVSANTIEIVDSTVSTNSVTAGGAGAEAAEASGGGIEAFGAAFSLVTSTVDHNSATAVDASTGSLVLGGGIYVSGTPAVNVTSSTFSANSAAATGATANDVVAGGGLGVLSGALTISGSTFASNAAPQGANLSDAANAARLRNTILSDPLGGGANCLEATPNTLVSDGYNLASDASCKLTATGDQPSTNPLLSALADNGGPTRTHALPPVSPAVDKGSAAASGVHPALTTDQRGEPRPFDQLLVANAADGSDVGAFELQAVALPAVVRTSTSWLLRDSLTTGGATNAFSYGTGPLVPVMGDWDGNGSRTAGTFAGGIFRLRNANGAGEPHVTFAFGDARGFPVAADFNGDGTDDVAVYRSGLWQVRYSTGQTLPAFSFGSGSWPATVPLAGDWDGDGNAGIGTYTYATATWRLRNTPNAGAVDIGPFVFGTPNATYPVVGDWDGDGDDTIGVKTGPTWTLRNTNSAGAAHSTFDFGLPNDLPLTWREAAAAPPPP